MATDSKAAAAPAVEAQESLPAQNKIDVLYDQCAKAPQGTLFFQRDLSNMTVAENLNELIVLVQELVDMQLMKPMTFDGEPCWKLRSRQDAEKLRKLTSEERLLYHHIDQAQAEGVWTKALRLRTNMTPQAVNKCLKSLENKDLVQSVMSVKFPARKMYLLKHLRPSEDIAGGPWQSEGDFDMALIDTVSRIVEQLIQKETCVTVPPGYNNYDRSEDIAQKKAQLRAVHDIEDAPAVKPYHPPRHNKPRLVLSHDPKLPTAASLLEQIVSLGIIRDKVIRESDMEQLLDMMVLEGRLEKIGANYRLALRPGDVDEGMNGFVDAPCGTCPVFDLCGDSGEISARTCVYFAEWLGTESEVV